VFRLEWIFSCEIEDVQQRRQRWEDAFLDDLKGGYEGTWGSARRKKTARPEGRAVSIAC
jgi:hypothetical protein